MYDGDMIYNKFKKSGVVMIRYSLILLPIQILLSLGFPLENDSVEYLVINFILITSVLKTY